MTCFLGRRILFSADNEIDVVKSALELGVRSVDELVEAGVRNVLSIFFVVFKVSRIDLQEIVVDIGIPTPSFPCRST